MELTLTFKFTKVTVCSRNDILSGSDSEDSVAPEIIKFNLLISYK